MFRGALLGIGLLLSFPVASVSQSRSTSSPPPLEVTVKRSDQQERVVSPVTNRSVSVPMLAFNIRNVSQKCVVGISLRTEDKDSVGKVLATGGTTIFRQRGGKVNCLEPGQAFNEPDRSISFDEQGNPPATKGVVLDFIVFSDGSTWGPGNDLEQKGYLLGEFHAYSQTQLKANCKSQPPTPD